MADSLTRLLQTLRPCLSTELVAALVKEGVAPATARQRVSRSTEIKKLAHLVFPRGARFVYLQSDYASPEFWHELVKRLLQHSASYGGGLAALMARGGVMPVRHFLIACGAPIAQKGHIPAQGVLDRLKSAQLVTCFDAPGIGECIELAQTVEATPWELNRLRARLNTEAVLLSAVKDWARNLALVSYNTVALRDTDDGQPRVGTFNWDLTGASYLGPLTQWDKAANKKKPGYLVCDVLLGVNVAAHELQPFINKCTSLRALAKVGRCMQVFVADGYTPEAFALARENGVVPATTTSLFGLEVAKALRELTDILKDAYLRPDSFDRVAAVFDKLSHIEGAATNLRGALFEYIVADLVRQRDPHTSIDLNEILKDDAGGQAEVDVLVYHANQSVRFIECKGYKPGGTVPDEMVEVWLKERIPVMRRSPQATWQWRECRQVFEYWTSGVLSVRARGLIADEAARVKRYDLRVVEGDELGRLVAGTNSTALKMTFRQHFQAHPLSEIERVAKRPPRRLAIPPPSRLSTRNPQDFEITTPLLGAPTADDDALDDVVDNSNS